MRELKEFEVKSVLEGEIGAVEGGGGVEVVVWDHQRGQIDGNFHETGFWISMEGGSEEYEDDSCERD